MNATTAAPDLRARLNAILQRPGVSITGVASLTSFSYQGLSHFATGYRNGKMMLHEIETVVTRIERGELSPIPVAAPPVDIEHTDVELSDFRPKPIKHHDLLVTRHVHRCLDFTMEHRSIGLMYGEFGVGKTHGIRTWKEAHPNANVQSFLFKAFVKANRLYFIQSFAQSLGLNSDGNPQTIYDDVVSTLRRTPVVLIFDQCEGTSENVLQLIRDIHDDTREYGVGVLLSAQDILYYRLLKKRSREIGALTSRMRFWHIAGVNAHAVKNVVDGEGIDIDEGGLAALTVSVAGSTRVLMNAVEILQATHRGRRVNKATIIGVVKSENGRRVFKPGVMALLRGIGGVQ